MLGHLEVSRDRYTLTRHHFARKLIRPFGSVTREDVETEVKAITEILAGGGHKHVIKFFDHGPLRASDYYYIDMELCDFNLDKYIYAPDRSLLFSGRFTDGSKESCKPAFCERWNSIQEKRENVWRIMDHITTGLEFLHGQGLAHRDLKPQNGQSFPSLCIDLFY
jgi:serine/threonine protein kinase